MRETYLDCCKMMRVMYTRCRLVHGDLSEYNILCVVLRLASSLSDVVRAAAGGLGWLARWLVLWRAGWLSCRPDDLVA